jgi:hypothetical protein
MVAAGVVASGVALYYLMDDGMDYKGKHSLENLQILTEDLKLEYTCIIIRGF